VYLKRISFIILVLLAVSSCKKTNTGENPKGTLEQTQLYNLSFHEPSGLTFGPGKASLLTVSDTTNKIYEIDLSGKVIRNFSFKGKDLEGITYNPDKNLIAVVEEKKLQVVLIDYDDGEELETYNLKISVGDESNGLEGISYNHQSGRYYLVVEKNPGRLIIWTPESGVIADDKLTFALDYSGIFCDVENAYLWIVSDESETLFKCDTNRNVLMTFDLPGSKYEGITIDQNILYVVNDDFGTLSIFTIKDN